MRLKDKSVLVTASTRGIGFAIVKACAREGAAVYMAARNLERAQAEADRLNAEGHRVKCVYNDATVPETFLSMVEDVVADVGRIDVLVNNFGSSNTKKGSGFCPYRCAGFPGHGEPQSKKCFYGKPGCGKTHGRQWGREHCQYLFCGRIGS